MKNVLIVEDNEYNLKLLKLIVASMGHNIFTAKDGEEGVRVAREKRPDLILMDIQMPLMDGIAAHRTLKEDPLTRDIPVMAVTSFAMSTDRELFISEGFAEHITKPIEKDKFIEEVAKILGR